MLVLEILQTCTSVLFAFDLRLFLVVLGLFSNKFGFLLPQEI